MRLSILVLAAAGLGLGARPTDGRHNARSLGRPSEAERGLNAATRHGERQAGTDPNGVQGGSGTSPAKSQLPTAPAVTPTAAPTPTPTLWDTSFTTDLSTTCLQYLFTLRQSADFTACLPFSLLLSSSNTFKSEVASASRTGNFTFMNDLLAYVSSPQPSSDTCDQLFAGYLKDIQSEGHCGKNIETRTPAARQARRGIGNYAVMRTAAGIVNPSTGVYCYVEAIASTRPDDLYLWMLPSGNILPQSSVPTCSDCSALLMNHYGSWSSNTTTLNSTILGSAANAINAQCGANFISVTASPGQFNSSDSQNGGAYGLHKNIAVWPIYICLFVWVFMSCI